MTVVLFVVAVLYLLSEDSPEVSASGGVLVVARWVIPEELCKTWDGPDQMIAVQKDYSVATD